MMLYCRGKKLSFFLACCAFFLSIQTIVQFRYLFDRNEDNSKVPVRAMINREYAKSSANSISIDNAVTSNFTAYDNDSGANNNTTLDLDLVVKESEIPDNSRSKDVQQVTSVSINKSLPVTEQVHVQQTEPQKCHRRDLSAYSISKMGKAYNTLPKSNLADTNCLNFNCSKNVTNCDNILPTNYDGPEPPCCVHILRDAARIFDEAMCSLGLDYIAGFGTLLGLTRSDRLIPWTADNDYIIPYGDTANAMVSLWDAKATGLAHVFQGINRMCITSDFAGGKLKKKWSIPFTTNKLWNSGLPYIDFYTGRNMTKNIYSEYKSSWFGTCEHLYSDVFPTKRTLVYNSTFFQNIPANTDQLLRTYYGRDWRVPLSKKTAHGKPGICPFSATYV